jgi:hypothetical protein
MIPKNRLRACDIRDVIDTFSDIAACRYGAWHSSNAIAPILAQIGGGAK